MTIAFRSRCLALALAICMFAIFNNGLQPLQAQSTKKDSSQQKSSEMEAKSDADAKESKEEKDKEKSFTQIEFESSDGVTITADLYQKFPEKDAPLIVLCHMAGSSRGEYREIAPKLNELGFNCLAIDQRSGGDRFAVKNMTSRAARKARQKRRFVDAEQDIVAAIGHVKENVSTGKVLIWGSSYSAGLVLRIAGEQPETVDGVLSFSPNEYFTLFGKPNDWIKSSAAKIKAPSFLSSAKFEGEVWQPIFDAIPGDHKVKFLPKSTGNHGSAALMSITKGNKEYWEAVEEFLKNLPSG